MIEAVVAADRAGRRRGRVGRTHHRPPDVDRALALQARDHDRPRGDELDELSEERLVAVLAVVLLRERTIDRQRADLGDPQALVLGAPEHLTDQSAADAVRLHDEQRRFHGHPQGSSSSARRASATVYREPVTRMRSPSDGGSRRRVQRVADRREGLGGDAVGGHRVRHLPRRPRPNAVDRRRVPGVRERGERGHDALEILVGEHAHHEVQPIPREDVGQRLGERPGGGGVVRTVQDDERPARRDLQSPGRRRRAERQPDGVRGPGRVRAAPRPRRPRRPRCAPRAPRRSAAGCRRTSRGDPGSRGPAPRRPASARRSPSRAPRAGASRSAPRIRRSMTSSASSVCSRTTATLPCLMMPAFSRATSAIVEPSSG